MAHGMGLSSFGKLSTDGTKVRANASSCKATSYRRMVEEERRLKGEVEALPKQARDADAEGNARFGESLRGDELPEELRRREDRLAPGREGKKMAGRNPHARPATRRMVEKLAAPAGRERHSQRKWLPEAPNGWIKEVLGFRRFSVRSLAGARGEWNLACLALNVKRLPPLLVA